MKLAEIKENYTNFKHFQSISDYQYLFGITVYKSGRKHIKEEHVYYCYTPTNFDYSVYKNFISELKDYEKKNNYEFGKTYNLSRYEIFGNYYLYQLLTNLNKMTEYENKIQVTYLSCFNSLIFHLTNYTAITKSIITRVIYYLCSINIYSITFFQFFKG